MNLKEAFQAQNKIEDVFDFVTKYLGEEQNLVSVTEKHLRSKAAEGQEDEKIDVVVEDKFPPELVIDFLMMLIDEREELAAAIGKAKKSMSFDLDSTVDVNKKRHLAAEALRGLREFKSSSSLEKDAGLGHIFNKDGNQTSYRYDVERVKTIDYDRNSVRKRLDRLQKKADAISNDIDAAMVSTKVKYKTSFDLHASAQEILEDYVTAHEQPKKGNRGKRKKAQPEVTPEA